MDEQIRDGWDLRNKFLRESPDVPLYDRVAAAHARQLVDETEAFLAGAS